MAGFEAGAGFEVNVVGLALQKLFSFDDFRRGAGETWLLESSMLSSSAGRNG